MEQTTTMTHAEMRELLCGNAGKSFVRDFTRRIYSWADNVPAEYYEYRIFNEFSIRYETGELTKRGLKKREHYRIDCVFFIQPGYRALNQGQCYTVGIELKGAANDLKNDDKIEQYLGWTDFLLIGVPNNLLDTAQDKVEEIEKRCPKAANKIGVMCVEDGIAYILPNKQEVSDRNYRLLYEQVLYNYMFKDSSTISFDLNELEIEPLPKVAEIPTVAAQIDSNSIRQKEEERKARYQRYIEYKKVQAVQAEELRKKNRILTDNVREKMATLPDRDQLVFWAIRDAGEDGITRPDVLTSVNQSPAGVSRSIENLKESGLITLEGSRKVGKYKITEDAAKSSRCLSCALKEECQGDALRCGSYQPIDYN